MERLDGDSSASGSSGRGSSGRERQARLETVVEQYLSELHEGRGPAPADWAARHPDLAPDLGRRLRFLERMTCARDRAAGSLEATGTGSSGSADGARSDERPVDDRPAEGAAEGAATSGAARIECPECGEMLHWTAPQQGSLQCVRCGGVVHVRSRISRRRRPVARRPCGSRIGRFELLEVVGEGGFGIVYRARDHVLDRIVAVKVPRHGYFATHEELRRFIQEARAVSGLRHPGIVQVHEVTYDHDLPVLICDYVDGPNLEQRLTAGRLDYREAAEIGLQVAEALAYAHQCRIVHRDVKPSNILLDSGGRAMLADFGLARQGDPDFSLTVEGDVIGTLLYMAPEQAEGRVDLVDGRADVYSLGAVLYHLVAGRPPFQGSKRMILHQLLFEELRPPRKLREFVPADLETIVMKATAKSPADRYATVGDLAADLRRWLNDEPILARPADRLERAGRWCRRHPLEAALATIASSFLVIGVLLASAWAWREGQARRRETAARHEADSIAAESRRRLSRLYLMNGVQSMRTGDSLSALPWLVESLALEPDLQPSRTARLRIGLLLHELPQLEQAFRVSGGIERMTTATSAPRGLLQLEDGSLVLVDLDSGRQLKTFHGPSRPLDARLTADGSTVAATTRDGFGLLWQTDGEDGEPIRLPHDGALTDLEWSPDGARLATASEDGSVRLWDARTGARLGTLEHADPVVRITFRPDGLELASATRAAERGSKIHRWGPGMGTERAPTITIPGNPFGGPPPVVRQLAYSPDGLHLATADTSGAVRLWESATGSPTNPSAVPLGVTESFAFSPDGRWLAAGCRDGVVRQWSVPDGAPRAETIRAPESPVRVRYSRDGRRILTDGSGVVRQWQAATGRPAGPALHTDSGSFIAGQLYAGRKLATYDGAGMVRVWELQSAADQEHQWSHGSSIVAAAIDSAAEQLATAGADRQVKLWSLADARPLAQFDHPRPVQSLVFAPQGPWLAVAQEGGEIWVWDVHRRTRIGRPIQGSSDWRAVVWAADPGDLATLSDDGSLSVWSVWDGERRWGARLVDRPLGLTASPDGTRLATYGSEPSVRFWDARDGRAKGRPMGLREPASHGRWSPDGQIFGVATEGGRLQFWHARWEAEYVSLQAHYRAAVKVNFSPQGGRAVSTGEDGTLTVVDVRNGTKLTQIDVDRPVVVRARFDPTGRVLASQAGRASPDSSTESPTLDDSSVQLWDASTGDPLSREFFQEGELIDAFFDRRRGGLVTVGRDGSARVRRLPVAEETPEALRKAVERLTGRVIDADRGGWSLVPERSESDTMRAASRVPPPEGT